MMIVRNSPKLSPDKLWIDTITGNIYKTEGMPGIWLRINYDDVDGMFDLETNMFIKSVPKGWLRDAKWKPVNAELHLGE